ncbi:hypothetical protein ACGFNP_50720 [Nonomuraea sp. NPDC049269]|uniref:hypothetical protein n=1 Tax=Nonomuraea sp. NPDC049269 TaxID=3364349 RepID=UPI00371072D1
MPFRETPDGLKVKDICRMLNTGVEPKYAESVRAQKFCRTCSQHVGQGGVS